MNRLLPVSKNLMIDILNRTLGYPIHDHPIGSTVVEMPSRDAFIYSVLTAHGYLDRAEPDFMYCLTRDAFRVFNQAEQYELQEGVFSLSDLRFASTFNMEVARKPYIRYRTKYILPVEYSNHSSFRKYLENLISKLERKGYNPNDFIIAPIRQTSSGVVEFEPFFEYVISTYFSRKGMITDTQIPFYYGVGTPDVAAYCIPNTIDILHRRGYVNRGGSVVEIMAASAWGFRNATSLELGDIDSVVCEVKTGQLSAPQIEKYIATNVFSRAYEVIPCEKEPETYAGLLTFDKRGNLEVYESGKSIVYSKQRQHEYLMWVTDYIKAYILANLTTSELENLLTGQDVQMNRRGIVGHLRKSSLKSIADSVKYIILKRVDSDEDRHGDEKETGYDR